MSAAFSWALVFHITGIVFWIGGLLMTTQVLAAASQDDPADATARACHQRTARRMLRAMAHPGAVITLASGGVLLYLAGRHDPAFFRATWLNIKLLLVVALLWLDWLLWTRVRDLDRSPAHRKDASMLHGVISAAFFIILILVFLKP
ncbi:MAG: CopD family protein [Terriglobales bacterium]